MLLSVQPIIVRCQRCGGTSESVLCRGNDGPCHEGQDGGAARACRDWSGYCCKCGERWALDQI
mgnify:CR=1 FL=1